MRNVLITEDKEGRLYEKKEFTRKDPNTGEIINDCNYKFMLTQSTDVFNNGYINTVVRACFVPISQTTFDEWTEEGRVKHGAIFPFKGKIAIKETLEPYKNKKTGKLQEPKRRGKNGSICTHNGEPIYRNPFFTMDMDTEDVFIKMDAPKAEMIADEPANDTDVDESAI